MSAGGLSYSAITNHGRVTLPSVESWGTNMNILRDPPKSIHTRKIDKVGETSSITQMVEDSNDRASEAIQVYARGVNPSVSVSYNNHGNNGGQSQAGNLAGLNGGQQAKLPYTIIKDGAFRPPVLRQEELMPLSRQPRVWTSEFSKPGFVDFSKRVRNCGSAAETKEVFTNTLQTNIRPTAVYKIETPLQETYDIKNNIQNTFNTKASSGCRTLNITQQNVQIPEKEIFTDPLHARAHTNMAQPSQQVMVNDMDTERYLQNLLNIRAHTNMAQPSQQVMVNDMDTERYLQNLLNIRAHTNMAQPSQQVMVNDMDTERYLQNPNNHRVDSNISSNISTFTSIEDVLDLPELPLQHTHIINHIAPYSQSGDGTKYIHDDIQMDRVLPNYTATTNIMDNTKYKQQEYDNTIELERNIPSGQMHTNMAQRGEYNNSSRQAFLIPKIDAGAFNNPVSKPLQDRIQQIPVLQESDKQRMSRLVMESQSRFGVTPPKPRNLQ